MSDRQAPIRRARPRKNLVMFLLSLALGGVGVFYSKHYIDERIDYYKAQLDKTEPMMSVVVPRRRIERGEILRREDLAMREIPLTFADTNSVTGKTVDTAVGQRVDFDIDQGRPVLWAHLEGGLTPTFSGKVPDGLRAMTVRVDDVNSISGFLQPNDRVDLLLSHGSGDRQRIVPLIEQLDVIATGTQTLVDKSAANGKRAFNTITVQVTPRQAQKITLAQTVGRLTAMLRNPQDEAPLGQAGMTLAELLGEQKPAAKAVPKRVRKARAPAPARIEYIIGGAR